ncbi:MAG: macro domain-containing protein [Deltaproteobacteria bacterium]|nr:MAG: macro domain-containing protein [Deltaproteobacteria bacterium]
MQVHVAQAQITNLPVDAIVNPANSMGIMGGGISGMIRRTGGDEIQREAMACAPIAVGAAAITTAGSLPAGCVIHAPIVEDPAHEVTAENVRRAARAALVAAAANELEVIAVPAMGTGFQGLAPAEAARAIVEEIRAHRRPFPTTIYLVDTDPEVIAAFEDALRNAQQGL